MEIHWRVWQCGVPTSHRQSLLEENYVVCNFRLQVSEAAKFTCTIWAYYCACIWQIQYTTICCHLGLDTAEISSVLPDPCNKARLWHVPVTILFNPWENGRKIWSWCGTTSHYFIIGKICLQSSFVQSDINLPRVFMQYSYNSLFFQQLVEDLGFESVLNLHYQDWINFLI